MLFHVQQKAKNAVEGSRFKSLGVVKGPSDLIYITYGKTVYIEMKIKESWSTQSDEQEDFEKKVKERYQEYYVVRTFEEFTSLIKKLQEDGRKFRAERERLTEERTNSGW